MVNPEEQPLRFTKWNAFWIIVAMVSPIAGAIADLYAGITYFINGHEVIAILTLFLMVLSALTVHWLSRNWYIQKQQNTSTIYKATTLGIVFRHWRTLQAGRKANRSGSRKDFLELYQCESDGAFLALYTAFLKAAPQLVLQVHVILEDRKWESATLASAVCSLVLLVVGVTLYDRDVRLYSSKRKPVSWGGVIIQSLWRFTSIASRIATTLFVGRETDCRIFFGFFLTILVLLTFMVTLKRAHALDTMTLAEDFAHTLAAGSAFTFAFVNVYDSGHPFSLLVHQIILYVLNLIPLSKYTVQQLQMGAFLNAHIALAVVLGSQAFGAICMGLYFKYYYPNGKEGKDYLIPYRIIHEME